jgi:hypothetical protein
VQQGIAQGLATLRERRQHHGGEGGLVRTSNGGRACGRSAKKVEVTRGAGLKAPAPMSNSASTSTWGASMTVSLP